MKVGRYSLRELSVSRLFSALRARWMELPHTAAWSLSPHAALNRQRLARYEDLHRGQRCFIVANGPSLARTDLDRLEREVSFGLNRIYLHFPATDFRPTYYAAVNELVLEQFAGEIAALPMQKFLNWNRRSYYGRDDPSVLFLKSRMVIRDSFQRDATRPLVMGGTVTFVALQLAYYMGFREVILIGLDHSYVDKGTPSGTEQRTAERDESHFHPQYFPKGSTWQLPDLLRSEIDFTLARRAFEADGRRILDATPGGKCPVFERVEYASLFE